jgi:hypothetical protein
MGESELSGKGKGKRLMVSRAIIRSRRIVEK